MKIHKRRKPKRRFYAGYIFATSFSLFLVFLAAVLTSSVFRTDSNVDVQENASSMLMAETEDVFPETEKRRPEKDLAPTAEVKQAEQIEAEPEESTPQSIPEDSTDMSIGENPLAAKNFAATEPEATEKLEQLQTLFPDGKYWNNAGTDSKDIFSVTETPCNHDLYGYIHCDEYEGVTGDLFPDYSNNIQCLAFASLMSDCIFGADAPIYEINGFENIRIGDNIRFVYYEHSVVVIDRGEDWISVTEVNANYQDCKIAWGSVITADQLAQYGASGLRIFSRY